MTIKTEAIERLRSRRRDEVDRARRVVLGTVLLLVGIGLVMIYSVSPGVHAASVSLRSMPLVKQLAWCLLAGFVMLVASDLEYQLWQKAALGGLVLTVVMLGLVLIPGVGTKVNGARRWLRFGGLGFQPSELAKMTLVVFMAHYVVKRGDKLRDFLGGVLPVFGVIGLVCSLVMAEPDFGTALFLAGISVMILVAGGMRMMHFMPVGLLAIPVLVHLVTTKLGHVQHRIDVFLHPEADPLGKGHQILQSLIALGSGGLTGRGLGLGRQKMSFLPEATTDFIFSALGEELGFLGCAFVILLFCGFTLYGIKIALCAPDDFGCYLGLGIVLVIGCQAAANIAVVTASVPTKGISLPFVSQGGSGLVIMSGMVGMLLNIARQSMGLEEAVA